MNELLTNGLGNLTDIAPGLGTAVDDLFKPFFEAIWSSNNKKTSVENAFGHWQKHKQEFPDIKNAKQYVESTKDFIDNPPPGALTKIRPNGEKVVYDPATNTFAASLPTGEPKTMFKPDPTKHGYSTNLDYFNAQ
jgi:filamentous hemagglutinin